MGTKQRPGTFDCYAAAEEDEPMFVLLARDADAADLVEDWARQRYVRACASAVEVPTRELRKIAEALQCANNMRSWRKANRPDAI